MSGPERVWTIIVAGGTGRRFGAVKQFELLGDRRVIDHARAVADEMSDGTVVVVPAADAERERGVAGGDTRSESVRAGLAAVPDEATIILVHDAARPFAGPDVYRRVIDAIAGGADGAIPCVPVHDTIKVVSEGAVVDTPERSTLVAVQTPQGFRAGALRAAHATGAEATDDSALVERMGGRVVAVGGDDDNRKITRPADLEWARRRLAALPRCDP